MIRIKKHKMLLTVVVIIYGVNCLSDDVSPSKEDIHYVFDGIELWAEHRSRLAPVIGSNGNRLIVDTRTGVKRVVFSTHFEAQELISTSTELIELSNLEYDIGYSGNHKNIHNGMAEKARYWVVANMGVITSVELENAYCVFQARSADVQVRSLGTLQVGIPKQIKLTIFSNGPIVEDDCSIYLFSGDGQPLATSESSGLRIHAEN